MPYISEDARQHYDSALNLIVNRLSERNFRPGHLTYVLYAISVRVLRAMDPSYTFMSRVRASLNDASDEFYRVEMAPYEDEKIKENGAV